MNKTVLLTVVILVLILSCDSTGNSRSNVIDDRKVTVALSAVNSGKHCIVQVFEKNTNPFRNTPLASKDFHSIISGTMSGVLTKHGTIEEWEAKIDTAYDIYVFVDMDSSNTFNSGDKASADYTPKRVTDINTGLDINLKESDFSHTI